MTKRRNIPEFSYLQTSLQWTMREKLLWHCKSSLRISVDYTLSVDTYSTFDLENTFTVLWSVNSKQTFIYVLTDSARRLLNKLSLHLNTWSCVDWHSDFVVVYFLFCKFRGCFFNCFLHGAIRDGIVAQITRTDSFFARFSETNRQRNRQNNIALFYKLNIEQLNKRG